MKHYFAGKGRWKRGRFSVVIIGVILIAGFGIFITGVVGTVCAVEPSRQKAEENSSSVRAPEGGNAPQGKDSLSDLAAGQPMSKEFLTALEARRKDVEEREKAVKEQEQQLLFVRQDIEAKLSRLEKIRTELEELTRQADRSRKKDLTKAVDLYAAMDAAQAARIFGQMDLETVVSVLKEMDTETAGGILDAMAKEQGQDPSRMARLKAIGESLVDPRKLRSP